MVPEVDKQLIRKCISVVYINDSNMRGIKKCVIGVRIVKTKYKNIIYTTVVTQRNKYLLLTCLY